MKAHIKIKLRDVKVDYHSGRHEGQPFKNRSKYGTNSKRLKDEEALPNVGRP